MLSARSEESWQMRVKITWWLQFRQAKRRGYLSHLQCSSSRTICEVYDESAWNVLKVLSSCRIKVCPILVTPSTSTRYHRLSHWLSENTMKSWTWVRWWKPEKLCSWSCYCTSRMMAVNSRWEDICSPSHTSIPSHYLERWQLRERIEWSPSFLPLFLIACKDVSPTG